MLINLSQNCPGPRQTGLDRALHSRLREVERIVEGGSRLNDLAFKIFQRLAVFGVMKGQPMALCFFNQPVNLLKLIHVTAKYLVEQNVQRAQANFNHVRRGFIEHRLSLRAAVDDHNLVRLSIQHVANGGDVAHPAIDHALVGA